MAEASTIYDYMCANATLLGVRILEQFPALHQVQDPLSPVSRNCKSGERPSTLLSYSPSVSPRILGPRAAARLGRFLSRCRVVSPCQS